MVWKLFIDLIKRPKRYREVNFDTPDAQEHNNKITFV